MLKLKDVSKTELIQNESDFYLKIKLGFESWYKTNDPLFYWSTGGGTQKLLLEIGINQKVGNICDLTVVTMPKALNKEVIGKNKNVIEKFGLPLFDISSYQDKDYYFEERSSDDKDFEVYAGDKSVTILFSSRDNNEYAK